MKFAKAVYVHTGWYVRCGPDAGIDLLIHCASEPHARLRAKAINQSLNRELKKRGYIPPRLSEKALRMIEEGSESMFARVAMREFIRRHPKLFPRNREV